MKETFYKLNRDKLDSTEDYTYLNRKIGYLVNAGILEEVQEEEAAHMKAVEISHMTQQEFAASLPEKEMYHVEQNNKCYIHKGNVFEYEPADTKEDMPYLVEVANRKLQEEEKPEWLWGDKWEAPKPFLDGMTPSEWIEKQATLSDKDMTVRNWGRPTTVLDSALTLISKTMTAFNLLVEELKKKGSL